MGRLTFRFLLGLIAGLVGWLLWEPAYPKDLTTNSQVELYMTLTAGAFIGATVAGLNGFFQGGRRHTLTGIGLGAMLGGVGISLGYSIGSNLVRGVFGPAIFLDPSAPVASQVLARILVLAPVGAAVGLAVGAATLNVRRVVQGLVGGALAGVAAGAVFDLLGGIVGGAALAVQGQSRGDVGGPSRALSFALIGGLIGLFIGLVDLVARQAWLRLNLGRNEGREWALDYPQNFIGRSEEAQIPLFGDSNVAPMHACVVRQGGRYVLMDGGSPLGTGVNGQRVQQHVLNPGDVIQVAGFQLQFLTKGAARAAAPMPTGYAPTQTPFQAQPMAPTVMGAPAPQPSPSALSPTIAMPAQAAMPTLVALDGPLAGQRFPVVGNVELGRAGTQVPMGYDNQASRRHALVAPAPGGLSVQDLGSTNGTFVNGQRVPAAPLRPGDLLKVGATTFRVE